MNDSHVDEMLRASAPAAFATDPAVRAELDRAVVSSRAIAVRGRRMRRLSWVALPVIAVPALSLMTTGGTDPRMSPDFVIPVTYTTDTGRQVDCAIELFNGEMDYVETNTQAVDYFRGQDWSRVGQEIYEKALVYETTRAVSPWAQAENDVLMANAPDGLFVDGGMGSDSTCSGELH
ncbi:hypothetical protein LQ938_06705 [Microbacterium sp. cx-55]|uniref:hypothetical protein n=1 Tax=unclassified Microbacterium TaxID=2609290 RepID=UPI001CBD24EA|nr:MULTISPECIES: hypothetical protein [unclassified Microbacterium]MBZ4486565.1 hypothetical protein [Microbacterium sp. cx-55]MCC4907533.1 hypothetical protein [Microbacterium sp. cx-59]UGB36467.1 hypothetical protein LQ938_06705 [Microbacterium sp. cx-55]